MANDRKSHIPDFLKKVFVVLVILIGLLVNVFLASVTTIFYSKAAGAAEIFFSPASASIPPDTSLQLMIDPKGTDVSFADVTLNFNTNVLRLSSEISTSTSPLTRELSVTSMSEANSTGQIQIGMFLQPGNQAPTSAFSLATLSFTGSPSASGEPAEISVIDEPTQLAGSIGEIDFVARAASINGAAPERGGPAGGIFRPIATLLQGNCGSTDYIDTAIGCIPKNNTQKLAEFFLRWGLGIGGGIALIVIVIAGYQITTSSGDPRKLQAGRELLTAAVTGLMLLVLAAFLLRFIGVDLLQIPGFS